jgi:hypothetical protein
MPHEHKDFLGRLQSLDEPTKKRVLIISTIVIMAIVIYFWLAYFNNLITGIAEQSQAPVVPQVPASQAPEGPGMWQNIYDGIANVFRGFTDVLRAPRQYLIKPN